MGHHGSQPASAVMFCNSALDDDPLKDKVLYPGSLVWFLTRCHPLLEDKVMDVFDQHHSD